MKERTWLQTEITRMGVGAWWFIFGFAAISVITAGVTLTHIFAPSYPPQPFDAVQYCLTNKTSRVRCQEFYESPVGLRYAPQARISENDQ